MGRLTLQTQANYRVKLRKLRAVLPLLPEGHPERMKLIDQIARLTDVLGKEMTDLEVQMQRGPGRPRLNPDATDLPTPVVDREQKAREFRQKYEAEHPDETERSAKALEEMMKGHETTDEPAKA